MNFRSNLEIEWLQKDEIRTLGANGHAVARLIRPLAFEYQGRNAYVPAGVIIDHASIPRVLWSLYPPVDPRYSRGAAIHDAGYQTGGVYPCEDGEDLVLPNRYEVDVLFLKAMEADGAGWLTRHTIFRAVRIGGWLAWSKHRKKEIQNGTANV